MDQVDFVPVLVHGLVERRRAARLEFLERVDGHVLPYEAPVALRDISDAGFSAFTTVSLRPGSTYQFRFIGAPHSVVTGRLVHSMRVRAAEAVAYLVGVEFTDPGRERAAIEVLIERAARDSA
jgi:hypothetical protein